MRVELEPDAVPIVRIFGARARRALADEATAKRAAAVRGVVGIESATDPQRATLRFGGDVLRIERGVGADAGVLITLDLSDDSAKPKVRGAARHPRLALVTGQILDPPVRPWLVEADHFCTRALTHAGCPRPLRVVNDETREARQWGGDGEPAFEVHGPGDALAQAFSGSSAMAEDVLAGKLTVVGDLRDLSLITRFAIDHLFGEL